MADHRGRTVGVAAAVVVLVAVGLVWWSRPFSSVVDGPVVPLDPGAVDEVSDPREVQVRTPDGALDVTVGRPVDALSPDVVPEDGEPSGRGEPEPGDLLAPRGSSLVPVFWTDPGPGPITFSADGGPGGTAALGGAVTLAVVVDGDTVARSTLDGTDAEGEDEAVAVVVDEPADLEVHVTFDGVTQVVDGATGEVDAGVAEALYRWDGEPSGVFDLRLGVDEGGCRWAGDLPAGFSTAVLGCRLGGSSTTPWRPDLGWVDEPGQAWVAVRTETFVDDDVVLRRSGGGDAGGRWTVDADYVGPTLDGVPGEPLDGAADSTRPADEQYGTYGWLVVGGDALELRVEARLRFAPDTSGPGGRALRGTATAVATLAPAS